MMPETEGMEMVCFFIKMLVVFDLVSGVQRFLGEQAWTFSLLFLLRFLV